MYVGVNGSRVMVLDVTTLCFYLQFGHIIAAHETVMAYNILSIPLSSLLLSASVDY